MKTFLAIIIILFTTKTFSCEESFVGKYIDETNISNILEIKVSDCVPTFELALPAESRTGHVVADNSTRLIWNRGGRTITEVAFVDEQALTINIIDKHLWDIYYQTQVYKLSPTGILFEIEIFNSKHTYEYKKSINYIRE